MCFVCVFFTFILDIKFVGRTSRRHTGGKSHRIFPARRIQPFLSLVDFIITTLPVVTKDLHISPRFTPYDFYRVASSAILQLVNQRLNFTYSRSHAFRYGRYNTNPTLLRIELTTSVLAGVQVTY